MGDDMNQTLIDSYKEAAEASLSSANSLPLGVYRDVDVFEMEADSVFRNDWVFVCAQSKLANAGEYIALDIAGELIAVVRGRDGQLRGLSNVCRHRGTPLLDEGFGTLSNKIVCPYHAWTFEDNGAFVGAPLTGSVKVDKKKHCLPTFAVDSWRGLIFINLSKDPQPLSYRLKGLDDYLEWFDIERFSEAYHLPAEHWNANWKLAVENGIESYHLFKVHKETLEPMTPSKRAYYVAGSSEWTLTGGVMKDDRSRLTKWLTGKYPEVYNHYLLVFLPPSFVGILTYDGFHWIQVLPDGPEHCRVIPGGLSEYKVENNDDPEFDFTRAFLEEDKVICERVQRSASTKLGLGGKLVSLEQILVDFHQYLSNRLFQSEPDPFIETENAQLFYRKEID